MELPLILLVVVNLVLLAERYLTWHLLWKRYQERERRADQLFDRLLMLKGIRPIAQPQLDQPRPSVPVLSQDERDAIEDRIKERLEIAKLTNQPISREQAEIEVWAMLGHPQPPHLNGQAHQG